MEKLAVRGYVEVLRHYAEITGIRRELKRRLIADPPDLFIGIDAPDFNLDLERDLKRRGISTVHYVSPALWAWRGGRIKRMAEAADLVLALYPFEPAIYAKAGVTATFIGHPLADDIPDQDRTQAAREQLRITKPGKVVTLLPGSRQSELKYLAALFINTAKLMLQRDKSLQFLVPVVSRETRTLFEQSLYDESATELPLTVLFGHSRDAIAAADIVLVASGTATLETALSGKPMVVSYRLSRGSWWLMSRMRYQPWVSQPNIIAGEYLVPELLQDDATAENLSQAMMNLMRDSLLIQRLKRRFSVINQKLRQNAAERAADALMPWLQ
jgi:lipid-A-disaccharide synthase